MKVSLRAPEPSDLDALYLWENDPSIRRYGSATAPFSRAMLWDYINTYDADPFHAGQCRFMIMADDATVGTVDLYDIDKKNRRAFVGIMVDSSRRGEGIAAAALAELKDYCLQSLGLHQLAAVIPEPNGISRELFLTSGFSEIAVLPQWIRLDKEFVDAFLFNIIL